MNKTVKLTIPESVYQYYCSIANPIGKKSTEEMQRVLCEYAGVKIKKEQKIPRVNIKLNDELIDDLINDEV